MKYSELLAKRQLEELDREDMAIRENEKAIGVGMLFALAILGYVVVSVVGFAWGWW